MKIKLSEAIKLIETQTGKKVVLKEGSQKQQFSQKNEKDLLKAVVFYFGREYGEGKKYSDTVGAGLLDAIRDKVGIKLGEIK